MIRLMNGRIIDCKSLDGAHWYREPAQDIAHVQDTAHDPMEGTSSGSRAHDTSIPNRDLLTIIRLQSGWNKVSKRGGNEPTKDDMSQIGPPTETEDPGNVLGKQDVQEQYAIERSIFEEKFVHGRQKSVNGKGKGCKSKTAEPSTAAEPSTVDKCTNGAEETLRRGAASFLDGEEDAEEHHDAEE